MNTCPSASALERFARDGMPEEVGAHAARCEACARDLADIRDNERFLMGAQPVLRAAADIETRSLGGDPYERKAESGPHADVVPGYTLVEEIGRGGQGVVFRAVQSATKRAAAVKVLMVGLFASERQRRRFEREVEIAARLRHPNLVTVFESGVTARGNPYVAMEFVEGLPIDRHVVSALGEAGGGRAERARVDAVMRLMAKAAAGVAHAHVSGVIHRDIKPSNILVDRGGQPRVVDFGLAREFEAGGIGVGDAGATRDFVGTPAYAAPEQFSSGASVNARADVYSLGLVMYTLLTGRHPYPCDGSLAEVARHAMETEPTPPTRWVKRLPSDVGTIVLKCLSKEPVRRYASAVSVAADIDDYLAGNPISARRASTGYVLRKLAVRHRIPAVAALLVLVTTLGAALGLALLASDLDRSRREMEAALSESDLQRARLMVTTGSTEEAESLLWRHAARSGSGPLVGALLGEAAGERRRAAWSLAELYSRVPRRFRTEFEGVLSCGVDASTAQVWAADRGGTHRRWTIDGDLVEEHAAAGLPSGATLKAVDERGRFAVYQSPRAIAVYDAVQRRVVGGVVEWPESKAARAISDDGAFVATVVDATGGCGILATGSMTEVAEVESDARSVRFARSPEGLMLVIGSRKGPGARLTIRRASDWRIVQEWPIAGPWSATETGLTAPRLSGDGRVCVTSKLESTIIADRSAPSPAAPAMVECGAAVVCMAFAEGGAGGSGRIVAAATQNSMIHLIDTLTAREIDRIATPSRATGQSAMGSGGGVISFASLAGDVCTFDAPGNSWRGRIVASDISHESVDESSDGSLVWADDLGAVIVRHGGAGGRETVIAGAHHGPITAVRFSPDATRVVSTGHDGAVKIWSVEGALERTVAADLGVVASAQFSPDGRLVAAAADNGTVGVWRSDDGSVVRLHRQPNYRHPGIAFSPDGARLLCGTIDCPPFVLRLSDGVVRELGGVGRTRAVAWSPDGRTVAIGSDAAEVRIWDPRSGTQVGIVKGLPWRVYAMAYDPSGRLLFVTGQGPEVVVVDPIDFKELATLKVHDRPIFSIAVSADGQRLVTSGQDSWIGTTDLDHLRRYLRGNEPYWTRRLAVEVASPSTARPTSRP